MRSVLQTSNKGMTVARQNRDKTASLIQGMARRLGVMIEVVEVEVVDNLANKLDP